MDDGGRISCQRDVMPTHKSLRQLLAASDCQRALVHARFRIVAA